jgi:hypothetical protein
MDALAIDYTFKHIEGDMDEWEVVGFSERFKCCCVPLLSRASALLNTHQEYLLQVSIVIAKQNPPLSGSLSGCLMLSIA